MTRKKYDRIKNEFNHSNRAKKFLESEINVLENTLNDFKNDENLKGVKKLREANTLLNGSVEYSLEAFDVVE